MSLLCSDDRGRARARVCACTFHKTFHKKRKKNFVGLTLFRWTDIVFGREQRLVYWTLSTVMNVSGIVWGSLSSIRRDIDREWDREIVRKRVKTTGNEEKEGKYKKDKKIMSKKDFHSFNFLFMIVLSFDFFGGLAVFFFNLNMYQSGWRYGIDKNMFDCLH